MRVETFGPLGRATFDPLEEANLLCIAGGSGIAGMMAILAHANSSRHFRDKRGNLFFGVRTLADAFFLDELSNEVRRASGGLRVIVATSEEPVPASAAARYPDLAFASGFVHGVAGQQMAGCYDAVIAYVAGPPPMVDATLHTLIKDARLPAHRIRYDKFT